jgi:hypothetical protein
VARNKKAAAVINGIVPMRGMAEEWPGSGLTFATRTAIKCSAQSPFEPHTNSGGSFDGKAEWCWSGIGSARAGVTKPVIKDLGARGIIFCAKVCTLW